MQFLDRFVDMPVVVQRQVHMVLTVQKPVDIAQLQILDILLTCPLLCNDKCPWS